MEHHCCILRTVSFARASDIGPRIKRQMKCCRATSGLTDGGVHSATREDPDKDRLAKEQSCHCALRSRHWVTRLRCQRTWRCWRRYSTRPDQLPGCITSGRTILCWHVISTRSALVGRSLAFTRVYQPQGPPAPQCPIAAFGLHATCHTGARGFTKPEIHVKLIISLLRFCQHLVEPSPISIGAEIRNDDAAYSVQQLSAAGRIIRRRRSQNRNYSA